MNMSSSPIFKPNFLYEICYGLRPAKFDVSPEDKLILDEEDEVSDMYFITNGKVGIGFYTMTQGLSKDQAHHLGITLDKHNYICDYYICFNLKSEFIFMAVEPVSAYSLSKKFLLNEIFIRHPKIVNKIKEISKTRYLLNVRRELMYQRE